MAEESTGKTATKRKEYRALVGLNYGTSDKRAEPGDVVSDLPAKSVQPLLDAGCIEEVS